MSTLKEFNFKNQKALIRVDFNVPLDEHLNVTDDTRIQSAKKTILKVLEDGGSCILMSHLGRPKANEPEFSLKNIVSTLEDILGVSVLFSTNCVGTETVQMAKELRPGQVLLLENLRYHSEEKEGSVSFAKALSELGDIYINDAFGTAHRAHASTSVIAQFFPRMAVYNDVEGWQNSQFWGRDEFALPFGNYEVDITVPADHILDGTGVLINRKDVYSKTMMKRYEEAKKSLVNRILG